MEKVKIKHKTLKIKIYPTNKQKKVLNEWSNTFRYIANVTIDLNIGRCNINIINYAMTS